MARAAVEDTFLIDRWDQAVCGGARAPFDRALGRAIRPARRANRGAPASGGVWIAPAAGARATDSACATRRSGLAPGRIAGASPRLPALDTAAVSGSFEP
jgi:hypothetical protein